MQIVPAILAKNFSDFKLQLAKVQNIFPLVQIDICDNVFVKNKTFKERLAINKVPFSCKLELHLMVKDPIAEMKKWNKVKNIYRVYIHAETLKNNFKKVYALAKKNKWQLGLVLNPKTKTNELKKYLDTINVVLFMTVHPGLQGQKLLKPILKKITSFAVENKNILIAADGGINLDNLRQLKKAGVREFCIGKKIIMAEDIKKTKKQFEKILK